MMVSRTILVGLVLAAVGFGGAGAAHAFTIESLNAKDGGKAAMTDPDEALTSHSESGGNGGSSTTVNQGPWSFSVGGNGGGNGGGNMGGGGNGAPFSATPQVPWSNSHQ